MRGIQVKKSQQESNNSHLSKKGSKLRTSPQIVKGSQMSTTKKLGQRINKGTIQNSIKRKVISRAMLAKTLGSKISRKQQLSKLLEDNGENGNEDINNKKMKKRKKRKRQKNKEELDEAPRLQRRTRYLLIKMKLEQNLIDAYTGEGWKGQSREKIKPESELQRAKQQILKCKLGIRDAIHQLESLGSVGCIEDCIICAICKLREAFQDNNILRCAGTCNCAFHQKCLDPPLATENIPPSDQGFFCRFCECKKKILEAMNAHLGTHFSVKSSWQDIFKEEADLPDGGAVVPNMEADWPSDDSEDDDYDPDRKVVSEHSGSDDANTSDSLSWSFEGESFSGSETSEKRIVDSKSNCINLTGNKDSDENNDREIIIGRRQRRSVDYKKLYDEMFGKDGPVNEQLSEDEEWGPTKRKRRKKESDAASTLMTLCETENKNPDVEITKVNQDIALKRSIFRLPPNAVQKLRQVFAENELPSRSVKQSLSKQLCLDTVKVNKWFKNARYSALKTRKTEMIAKEFQSSTNRISKKLRLEITNNQTGDLTVSRDTSSPTLIRSSKNLKKVLRRKNPKLLISSISKKNKLRRALLGSPSKSEKGIMELSDDLSLKNQLQLIKSKCKKEKKHKSSSGVEAAEMQMERLCCFTIKLENMKRVLSRLQNRCESDIHGQEDVIYIPVAELGEKLL